MNRLTPKLLLLAAVVTVAATAPGVALAGGGGSCSACSVYVEQIPTTTGHNGKGATTPATVRLPKAATGALTHVDAQTGILLRELATQSAHGAEGVFSKSQQAATSPVGATSPSAAGALLDLGSGPTVLLAVLAACMVLVAAGSAVRRRRR